MATNSSSRFKADIGYTKRPKSPKRPKSIKLPMPNPLKPAKSRKDRSR